MEWPTRGANTLYMYIYNILYAILLKGEEKDFFPLYVIRLLPVKCGL